MANILDYLEWRGDISLSEDPFNAVDNLVLSWMAYVNLDEIMPNGIYNQAITIEEAIKRFFAKLQSGREAEGGFPDQNISAFVCSSGRLSEIWTDEDHKLCESYQ